MTMRDELARLVQNAYYAPGGDDRNLSPTFLGIADALLAAGWRQTRTITTVAELEALPEGAVIRFGNVVCQLDICAPDPEDHQWIPADHSCPPMRHAEVLFPAVVLWMPEARQ